MVTVSARTFRYSRRDEDTGCTHYIFVDQHSLDRQWELLHWHGTLLYQAVKFDRRRTPAGAFSKRVILPTKLLHAMMAALERHRRLVASAK
ncbi:MAG: hypothetical protein J0I99_00505 [Devosia sp.]|uniref:hypothetical protein n=1 Tax=Devosia sp. TaxID=1871048 RepID=UPI001AC78627|nr:hypothetical protein [Devosia sp.]MBN9310844.1 hypothetical protein [Devosia sp.]MBN9314197.1 hypothetical protein [Devosia sp.]